MTKTNKPFDCVEMKHAAQHQLRDAYEKRKDEFSSYIEFINATVNETGEIRDFRKNISTSKHHCA